MDNKTPADDDDKNCHFLRVEDLIAEGKIPVDVVTGILFEGEKNVRVILQSNFDPIPLRLKLTKLVCIIDKQDTPQGWLFHIHRDCDLPKEKKTIPQKNSPSAKATFSFNDGMIIINVRSFDYPNDFLEVLRFMDTSLDADCFGVEIKRFTRKFEQVLAKRGWICSSETNINTEANEYQALILEKE
jgi:hypothetical protein